MAVTLVAHSDMDPCPRVEIIVDAAAGAVTVTVTRTWDDVEDGVRSGRAIPAGSPTYIVDYETPPNTEVTYRADLFDAAGALVESVSATTQVVWSDAAQLGILQAPLAPATARPVLFHESAVSSMTYSRDLVTARGIEGGAPLAFAAMMGAAEEVPLSMYARDDDEAAALVRMIRSYSPLLLRSSDPIELPRAAYIAFPEMRRVPIHRRADGWSVLELTGLVVRAPAAGVAVPIFTYDDVKALWGLTTTYDDVKAARPGASYLDWKREPRP